VAPTSSSERDYLAIASSYARDVISGKIPACKQVVQACKRHFKDLQRSAAAVSQADPKFEFYLDADSAVRVCQFLEALPHVKGKWALKKEMLRLDPWQVFIFVSLFGWVERADPTRYRFREAYICVPRKNGKSFKAAGTGLYKFAADGEYCSEVYFGATSEEQAKRVGFKPARAMAVKSPALCKAFGIKVNVHNLVRLEDGSILKPVIARPGDGDSPSCAIIDEYHEHPTPELYDTMKTGMGARENPLLLVITTAGSNRGGPCFLLQKDVEAILAGTIVNERLFGIIYTIDPEDDWTSDAALVKANPNFGISIDPEFLRNEQHAARQSARKQNIFKTKYLNIWVNAAVAWMNMEKWKALSDPALLLEQFAGEPCLIALDLASEIDIASKVYLFSRELQEKQHFYCFCKHYLNQQAIEEGRGEHYAAWAEDGWLTATPGNVTDYPMICDDLIDDSEKHLVREVPHDPYHGAPLVQFVQKDPRWDQSIEFVKITQNVQNLSPAMKQLEALVLDGRLHHDGDPVLEWMISNVVARTISKDNIVPDKESPERKIDAAVALLMDISRASTLNVSAQSLPAVSIL
jgi:phage terminase large subunit-like protein